MAKVTQSIMMYAAPTLDIRTCARSGGSLFRLNALRVDSGFRTVHMRLLVTSTDVIAMVLKRVYDRVKIIVRILTTEERREERRKAD